MLYFISKLIKINKKLIKTSHIIPEFLYQELYNEKHQMVKINAIEKARGIEKVSNIPKGEYEANLLCKECDGNRIGPFESYVGKILSNAEMPEEQKLECEKIAHGEGIEFLRINNIDYKLLKLFLLSILWRASISKRSTFNEVSLGSYEEKIRKNLFENDPSDDNNIPRVFNRLKGCGKFV